MRLNFILKCLVKFCFRVIMSQKENRKRSSTKGHKETENTRGIVLFFSILSEYKHLDKSEKPDLGILVSFSFY